jgi:hypothetical protein
LDKALAKTLLDLSTRATGSLTSLCAEVKTQAPGLGAQTLESGVQDASFKIVLAFMSPAWEQYPELKPGPDRPDEEAYDPHWYTLPKELVIKASWELTRVQHLVAEMKRLVETSALSDDEREWFHRHIADIDADLNQQQFSVRQKHPDFWGIKPKEEIPAVQQQDAADKRRA